MDAVTGRSPVMTEAEVGGMQPQAQDVWGNKKLGEETRTLPWSLQREHGPGTP